MQQQIRAAIALLERAALEGGEPETGITVEQIWTGYWNTYARHLRSGKSGIKVRWIHLGPFFGERAAASITKALAEEYRDKRRGQNTRRGKPPAPATINRELAALRALLNWATEQRPPMLRHNPLTNLHLEEENNVRQSKLGHEAELDLLLAECSPLVAALVLVAIDSGLRRLEVMRLRWDQIDPETRFVRLPGARTKNKRPRHPILSRRALAAVWDLPRNGEFVFANPKRKKPYNPRHLYGLYKKAVKASGLQGVEGESIVLHTLRHSFAYKARVKWRWSERTTMSQAGWTTRAAFDRYGIEDPYEAVQASELAEEAIEAERRGMLLGVRKNPHRRTVPAKIPRNGTDGT